MMGVGRPDAGEPLLVTPVPSPSDGPEGPCSPLQDVTMHAQEGNLGMAPRQCFINNWLLSFLCIRL